ncbi:MAG: hypothetical protein DHS20C14_18020 [Phycisphaeraceae bacterium]|nr:MAG: hypothetical protein DHS20C14_18020 [Phycisphaeraceae bacterium]
MIAWDYFPRHALPDDPAKAVICTFEGVLDEISSDHRDLSSNEVLGVVGPSLQALGFRVEVGKADRVMVPVLFGRNGEVHKHFEADAWNPEQRIVVEVEAGAGVANNSFLKDLFQACVMKDVDVLVIALRRRYRQSNDFERVSRYFETLYASDRMNLPLKGILLIGY